MIANKTSTMPAPFSPTVESLIAHEREVLEKPTVLRERVLARARQSLQDNVVPFAPCQHGFPRMPNPLKMLVSFDDLTQGSILRSFRIILAINGIELGNSFYEPRIIPG